MPTHKGIQELKTNRLLLRQYKMSDATQMFKNYASDPNVTRFLNWEPYVCKFELYKISLFS